MPHLPRPANPATHIYTDIVSMLVLLGSAAMSNEAKQFPRYPSIYPAFWSAPQNKAGWDSLERTERTGSDQQHTETKDL
eukprot:1195055-Prorocentrum_minimum.AAC.4